MSKNFAVIDLGTNTFHLLIARTNKSNQKFETLYKERHFVKLAENGIKTISDAAYQRGLRALGEFKKKIDQHDIESTIAIGTAGLRTASNGPLFVQQVRKELGIDITLIDGYREAELIRKGVDLAIPDLEGNNYLIMDIGGGSVEFIIAHSNGQYWAQSFAIGVAVLHEKFDLGDPAEEKKTFNLKHHIKVTIGPLIETLKKYPSNILVGAAGTFDVLENMAKVKKEKTTYSSFGIDRFEAIFHQLIGTTLEERFADSRIPNVRAEMLIASLVLIQYITEIAETNQIVVSAYTLKEGVLSELMRAV